MPQFLQGEPARVFAPHWRSAGTSERLTRQAPPRYPALALTSWRHGRQVGQTRHAPRRTSSGAGVNRPPHRRQVTSKIMVNSPNSARGQGRQPGAGGSCGRVRRRSGSRRAATPGGRRGCSGPSRPAATSADWSASSHWTVRFPAITSGCPRPLFGIRTPPNRAAISRSARVHRCALLMPPHRPSRFLNGRTHCTGDA